MEEVIFEIVDFKHNCPLCVHYDETDHDAICNMCFREPVRRNTTIPLKWEKKED